MSKKTFFIKIVGQNYLLKIATQNCLLKNIRQNCILKIVRQNCLVRDRTLSMCEGAQRVFMGTMKSFKHILMGHEIFLKISDGLQNIFLYVLL